MAKSLVLIALATLVLAGSMAPASAEDRTPTLTNNTQKAVTGFFYGRHHDVTTRPIFAKYGMHGTRTVGHDPQPMLTSRSIFPTHQTLVRATS